MTAPRKPAPPKGLRAPGRALWQAVVADLDAAGLEPDSRESAVLEAACREADLLADLQAAVDRDGPVLTSPTGTVRTHPAVAELRQHRIALEKLLGSVQLPDADGVPRSTVSAKKAAGVNRRWDAHAANRGTTRGA
ncbi:MAG: hypothetical protein R2737_02015 [Candidatus Nanopelagicales bacterium]